MFGIGYIKTSQTEYVIHYQGGQKRHAGAGLAFFYYRPSSTLSLVPVGSADALFIFNEMSADFQPLTLQGALTYRIIDPQRVAGLLNYSVAGPGLKHQSEDPEKLPQRLVNLVQALARSELERLTLREALQATQSIAASVMGRLESNPSLAALGVEALALSIQAIKPIPETARALEAETREAILRRADEAIYDRRNAAVEQERRIKENELNTEIAVEEKKRLIRENKVEADLAVEAREQQVREQALAGQVRLEAGRKQLVGLRSENQRAEADAHAYSVEASLRPLRDLDPALLEALTLQSAEPRRMVSLAMKNLAQNAAKIGNLNLAPDLLERLLEK